MAKNRSLHGVNEDFESFFNAVFISAVIRAKVSTKHLVALNILDVRLTSSK
jgi:hypothetical protein